MFVLVLSVAALSLIFILYKKLFKTPNGLPPLMGPGYITTVKKLTTIDDLTMLKFLHDLSTQVTSGTGEGKTSNGAVFRINMPQLNPYIITTDYKLARKFLEGSAKEKIPEGEKPSVIRAFDFTSTPSLFT